MRRRSFLGAASAVSALTAGCDFSLRNGLRNACLDELPADLREHPLILAAWRGLDATQVWDTHCHVFGDGDSGSGLWFNPRMTRIWNPLAYVQKAFYVNAACVDESPGTTDSSFVQRLLLQCRAMPAGFRVLLFAFDWARDDAGAPLPQLSSFHVPDDYVAELAARHPAHFVWAASIHPADPRALDRLDAAVARGAKAVKWLPSAQNIDPADARCDRFFAKLAQLRLPLISHGGDERALVGFSETLDNPLRLRRPLLAGVRVVVAHCASLGKAKLDEPGAKQVSNFELFIQLMDDAAYRTNLFGDISAVTQSNRKGVVSALIERRDWQHRLLSGSDYPLPGIKPLIDLRAFAEHELLDPAAVEPLRRLRDSNVLLFDFVLKRSLKVNGSGFDAAVFETAPFFARAA